MPYYTAFRVDVASESFPNVDRLWLGCSLWWTNALPSTLEANVFNCKYIYPIDPHYPLVLLFATVTRFLGEGKNRGPSLFLKNTSINKNQQRSEFPRGHYMTNPNNALLQGKSLETYHKFAMFDALQNGSHLMNPGVSPGSKKQQNARFFRQNWYL